MTILINDQICEVPFDAHIIPLSDYLRYKTIHGEILFNKVDQKQALNWYSFWTGFDISSYKEEAIKQKITDQFYVLKPVLVRSVLEASNLPSPVAWEGAQWLVQSPTSIEAFELTLGRAPIIDTVLELLHHYHRGKFENLLTLCAIFFRKNREPYSDIFIQSGSDRMKMLETMPVFHAFQVLAFLHQRFSRLLQPNTDSFSQGSISLN